MNIHGEFVVSMMRDGVRSTEYMVGSNERGNKRQGKNVAQTHPSCDTLIPPSFFEGGFGFLMLLKWEMLVSD